MKPTWHEWGHFGPSGHIIAEGINSYGDGPAREVARVVAQNPADAKLMIAAPDLRKALLGALFELRRVESGGRIYPSRLRRAIERADAAITYAATE